MNVFKAFFAGLNFSTRNIKLIILVYFLTLIFALLLGIPFYSSLNKTLGSTMITDEILKDFNFTVISDIMRSDTGAVINAFLKQMFWAGIFYSFFAVFFAGGIVKQLITRTAEEKVKTFFSGSAEYFFRFFRLALITFGAQLLIAIFIYAVFGLIVSVGGSQTEKFYVVSFLIAAGIHAAIFLFILIVSDNAKFVLAFDDSKKSWRAFFAGLKFVLRKITSLFPLYLIIIILFAFLVYIYFTVTSVINPTNVGLILILFVIQQLFILARIGFKFWFLSGHYEYYKPKHVTGKPEEEVKAEELEKTKQEIRVDNPFAEPSEE